nr:outer membrane protein assembly factor [Gammaproteobacteria bacterium]
MRRFIIFASLIFCAGAEAADTIEVRIEGLEDELEENVRAFLSIVARSEEQADQEDGEPLSDQAIRRLHRQAPEEIRRALQPFGFYSPAIETNLESGDGIWIATYEVNAGAPTRLDHVEIRVEG